MKSALAAGIAIPQKSLLIRGFSLSQWMNSSSTSPPANPARMMWDWNSSPISTPYRIGFSSRFGQSIARQTISSVITQ